MILRVKKASISDSSFFFNLRNDSQVRKAAFKKKKIKFHEHTRWFKNNLKKKEKIYLIAYTKKSNAIGSVRYDIDNFKAFVSIAIDKKFRGKGYGARMLKMSEKFLKNGTLTISKIKKNNKISLKTFKKNKFFITGVKSHITLMKLI